MADIEDPQIPPVGGGVDVEGGVQNQAILAQAPQPQNGQQAQPRRRTMKEYLQPNVDEENSPIVWQPIQNNFEIKSHQMNLIMLWFNY